MYAHRQSRLSEISASSVQKQRQWPTGLVSEHQQISRSTKLFSDTFQSFLSRNCGSTGLSGRIDCIEKMRGIVATWNTDRNERQSKGDWQCRTDDARIKLKRLYPKI